MTLTNTPAPGRCFTLGRSIPLAAFSGLLLLAGCGSSGGGGGDEFIGAARVQVEASPSEIDSGDRTEVRIRIDELHNNGISLKIRFPSALEYVPGSSFLTVDDFEDDVSPTNIVADRDGLASRNDTYLVFYFSRSQMGDDNSGELVLQLEGRDQAEDDEIEVDPDVDDPRVPNLVEFNPESPEFGAEATAPIAVID